MLRGLLAAPLNTPRNGGTADAVFLLAEHVRILFDRVHEVTLASADGATPPVRRTSS